MHTSKNMTYYYLTGFQKLICACENFAFLGGVNAKSMLKRWTRRKNVTSLGGGNTGTHTFEHAKVFLFTLSRRATGTGECTKACVFVSHCAFPSTSKHTIVFTRERAFSGTPWGVFLGSYPGGPTPGSLHPGGWRDTPETSL